MAVNVDSVTLKAMLRIHYVHRVCVSTLTSCNMNRKRSCFIQHQNYLDQLSFVQTMSPGHALSTMQGVRHGQEIWLMISKKATHHKYNDYFHS